MSERRKKRHIRFTWSPSAGTGQLQAGISLKDSVKKGIGCGSWTACLGSWSKCQGINTAWGKVNLKSEVGEGGQGNVRRRIKGEAMVLKATFTQPRARRVKPLRSVLQLGIPAIGRHVLPGMGTIFFLFRRSLNVLPPFLN